MPVFSMRQNVGLEDIYVSVDQTNNDDFPVRISFAVCRPKGIYNRFMFVMRQILYALRGYRTEYNFYLDRNAMQTAYRVLKTINKG